MLKITETIDDIIIKVNSNTRGATIHNATSKTTLVDNDELAVLDSTTSFSLNKLTWANLKATLKTYFDGIYATSTYLNLKAPLESPVFTGTPTAPTATTGTNTTQLATTAYANAIAGGTTVPSVSKATNGYMKMANGVIIQWGGYVGNGAAASYAQTFPIAFPNALFKVITGGINANNSGHGDYQTSWVANGLTGFTGYGYNNSGICTWIAIGY